MTESAADPSSPSTPALPTGEIIARGDPWFRRKWLIIGVVFLAGCGWFLYDGFVGYPSKNQEEILKGHSPPNNNTSIALQKIIGFALFPLSIFMIVRAVRATRGELRLTEDNTLHVPGHPPVPLGAIRAIDESKWDRKGIALIDYEVDGQTSRLKLDDFAYEREPTDQIHDRLVAAIAPPEGEPSST